MRKILKKKLVNNIDYQFLLEILRVGGVKDHLVKPKIYSYFNKEIIKEILDGDITQLSLFITEKCNLNCAYCVYGNNYPNSELKTRVTMPWNIAKKAIDYYLDHSANSHPRILSFYGGEPLLGFETVKRSVKYISSQVDSEDLLLNMTTNATLLDESMIDFIVHNDIKLLISLDGNEKIHDKYRKYKTGEGSHNKIIKVVEYIKSNYPDYFQKSVSTNSVITPAVNINDVYEYFSNEELFSSTQNSISYVKSFGTDKFYNSLRKKELSKVKSERKYFYETYIQSVISGEGQDNIILTSFFNSSIKRIHNRVNFEGFSDPIYPNAICVPGARKIVIFPNGDIHFCDQVTVNKPIGNLKSGIDISIVKSYIDLYVKQCKKSCVKCWAIRLCDLCYIHQYEGNIDNSLKERICITTKKGIKQDLIAYCKIMETNPDALSSFC